MTNSHNIRKLRNCLAAATILTVTLAAADSQAREDFYNLRYTEPSVVVNLGAIAPLNPQAAAPVVAMQPVYSPGPKLKSKRRVTHVAKKKTKPVEVVKAPEEIPAEKETKISENKIEAKTESKEPVEIASVSPVPKAAESKPQNETPAEKAEPASSAATAPVATPVTPPMPSTPSVTPPPPPPVDGNIGGRDKMVALPQKTQTNMASQAPARSETPPTPAEKPKKAPEKPVSMPKVAEFSAGPLPTSLTEPNAVAPAKTETETSSKSTVSSSALPPVEAVKADSDKAAKNAALDLPPLSGAKETKATVKEEETASITIPEKPGAEPPKTMPAKETVIVQPQDTGAPSLPEANSSTLSIVYGEAEIELPPSEKSHLEDIVSKLNADKNSRVTVVAYASGTTDQASQAKRTALARALAVRKYLMDRNISSERMDIRPLGNKSSGGVPDRVDIFINKTGRS